MHSRPIRGRAESLEATREFTRSQFPSPGQWVIHTTYPDRTVWYRYPATGDGIQCDRDYVLNSSHRVDHPPYDDRCETAVLERCWPDETPQWKATPVFKLSINSREILTVPNQPTDEDELNNWWDTVTDVLLWYSEMESPKSLPGKFD